jgi:hypothetical protein
VFRFIAVALVLVLWFALACVIVPRIVPPMVDVWERFDLGRPAAADSCGRTPVVGLGPRGGGARDQVEVIPP